MPRVTREEKKIIKAFESHLGYSFKDKTHLKRALTHKSYTNEQKLPATEHNERYEFLGDAVLELCISTLLMQQFSDQPEGELSKMRAALVNEHELAELAKKLSLGEYLFLGKGEDLTGGREKSSLLSDAYEAVLGAVYLDRGYKKVAALVAKHFAYVVTRSHIVGFEKDYKTRLQEEVQSRFRTIPRYALRKETGPDHKKIFEVELSVRDKVLGLGKGSSKKAAEQDAAKLALEHLAQEELQEK
ncbi:MAG: ribonuclease III [Deltaproteobacteria bacterium CG_4_10_14_0_2_um_filter_43_8]|nr:MAG: ribonuclease III [Deltaproteobacteria bacterium CG11_big_fil_rev_8_21_14_0_20_42_23]PJA18943.1 MAG: ribonuclease III [Deltaproteobacteria bacterium CG_4_10_14_0_2_um_filter_43_8]PJC64671.1 MAG: ribonuclease III [Deltaproteobacteria bacterium CG_4_9_14_0_2_um_filter_42_21]